MSLLEARALTHIYSGNVYALDGLNLRVERGQRLAILGPNGAGKTTVFLHLNGTLRPRSGEVRLDGQVMGYDKASLIAWRRRVGLVLQNADDQLFAPTVAEDVSFGPLNLGCDEVETGRRVAAALQALRVSHLADRATHMLSFGQKKRVAIAGLLAMKPEILLLDEPTAGLDYQGTEDLLAVLEKLEQDGTTLVFSTHDVELAYRFANEVALFHNGKVLAQGPIVEILSNQDLTREAHLEPPLLLKLGLQAQKLGMASAGDPLPRTAEAALRLMETVMNGTLQRSASKIG
jgi:cobalt/nickel transport system ATP-binding protein